jgi:hypothetical protein
MESHPCEKTRGEGVPSSITLTPDATSVDSSSEGAEAELCRHIDARGHRCRMLVMRPEEPLCAHHAQRRNQPVSESAQELLACGTDFADAPAVNRFLGALVRQVTLKRIPRRDAVTLAYICQLLLNSLGAISREEALRLEESRIQAMNAAKRPPRILWDIPGPPYEPAEPVENVSSNLRHDGERSRS